MFEEDTRIEREKQQAEGKHSNAPVGQAELLAWKNKTIAALNTQLDDMNDELLAWKNKTTVAIESRLGGMEEDVDEWIRGCHDWIDKMQKQLVILKEKEAKLDAAILRAETLEKCYLTVFKGAMDKNSVQPQETPALAPASTESAPAEAIPVISAPPAPAMAVQAGKGYVPKAEEVLNHPSAAQLGKKSIRLLQELAGIMDRKALYSFTEETAKDLLDLNSARTCTRHLSTWQKFDFIEKKGSLYRFVPPPPVTTAPTQPQEVAEGSQPAV